MTKKAGKVIFVDRDGVINRDPGSWTKHSYVTRWKDFYFLRGAKKAIKLLSDKGFGLILISNQAGVSKGFFTEKKLDDINEKMLKEIRESGGKILKTYYCIHRTSDACDCRKPEIGLFKKAKNELGIGIKGAYFIGDGKVDVEAGKKCGLKTILVLSGKTSLADLDEWETAPDHIFKDLMEAARFITDRSNQVRHSSKTHRSNLVRCKHKGRVK